ncbi:MAG: hypothetical protein JWP43_1713 [Ramlibacter sp.]|jgi:uncharacterized protein VirK/YbjX|nr:hypothetical protein [Ramlibacter sp.]
MTQKPSQRLPDIWQGVRWAMQAGAQGGGTSRRRLAWRAANATLGHGKALRRWMAMVVELHSREIVRNVPGEYLRAVRPYVHRHTGYGERVGQLIDHMDWLEGAFHAKSFEQIAAGRPLVLAELTPPRGCDFMRLQLEQAPSQSPEGELLLTLSLQRASDIQHKPQPVDAGVLAFSCFRVDGIACLVIGGVRGPRHASQRMSPTEINQALQGWKPSVFMVRVAQELARHWGLRLIGLDPAAHRLRGWSYQWNKRNREGAQRIFASYDALWEHFEATNGPRGWVIVPMNSDDKLSATALSPEKRERQTRRADYWIRTRNLLRVQFKQLLQRPSREAQISRITQTMDPDVWGLSRPPDYGHGEDGLASRLLETGPGTLP